MKKIAFISVLAICIAFLASCNEAETPQSPDTIDGFWTSIAPISNDGDMLFEAIEFNGSAARVATMKLGKTSLVMAGTPQTAEYSFDKQSGTGTMTIGGGAMAFVIDDGFLYNTTNKRIYQYGKNKKMTDFTEDKALESDMPTMPEFVGPTDWNSALHLQQPLMGSELGSPFGDFILEMLENVLMGAGKYAGSELVKEIMGDATRAKLDAVLAGLTDIKNQLDKMTLMFENEELRTYLNQRYNEYASPLHTHNATSFINLEYCDGTDEAIAEIVRKWGNATVGGNPAYEMFENYINFLTGTTVGESNLNLFGVYDAYAFNTIPWEHQAYDIRESLRAADVAIIGESVLLTVLYHKYDETASEEAKQKSIERTKELFDAFSKLYDDNKVERREDVAVCQIKGAHVIMNRNLIQRHYDTHPWLPDGSEWESENQQSAWFLYWGDMELDCGKMFRKAMTEDEVKAIAAFYDKSPIQNMQEVLFKEALCSLDHEWQNGETGYMAMQAEAWQMHDQYEDWYITPEVAVVASNTLWPTHRQEYVGSAYLERHGFLWMLQRFARWARYDKNHIWYMTDVTGRY